MKRLIHLYAQGGDTSDHEPTRLRTGRGAAGPDVQGGEPCPMSGSAGILFVCPECAEHIEVNESMKAAILESGCIVCGTAVSATAFERD